MYLYKVIKYTHAWSDRRQRHFLCAAPASGYSYISFHFNTSGECVRFKMVSMDGRTLVGCCALFEFLFLHTCTFNSHDISGLAFNDGSFDCVIWYNDTPNQVVISGFGGVFAFKNAEEKDHCYEEYSTGLEDNSKINHLVDVCKMELRSLKIKSNENTDFSNITDIERYAENITEITWEIHTRYTGSKLAGIFKHLEVLTILIDYPGYITKFRFDSFNQNFLGDKKKLQKLKLSCESHWRAFELPIELFQGLTNLSELSVHNCKINNISAAHFQDLTNLRVLSFERAVVDNFDFLRYVVLV